MHPDNNIDLGAWCRRIVLVALLVSVGAVGLKIGAVFWQGWSLGQEHYREASLTVDKCAKKGAYDTRHFRDSCEKATEELAKDPLVFAIEHTWDRLWPCETPMCGAALAHLTRSLWTVIAASAFLSFAVLYFTGCSRPAAPAIVWTPPPPTAYGQCHPAPNACIVDVKHLGKVD